MVTPQRPRVLLEIAVDDVEGALAAVAAGADRLELCAGLGEGGLTPSVGLLTTVQARVDVPISVMIRPRGGDFMYSPVERQVMRADIEACQAAGADGVVFGLMTKGRDVDVAGMQPLCAAAGPLPVTFHRAFDDARDQAAALDALIALGCARVLTSGAAATALAGVERLRALVAQAQARLVIVAAGGVRAANVDAILASGVREVHAGARREVEARAGEAYSGHVTTDGEVVRALARRIERVEM